MANKNKGQEAWIPTRNTKLAAAFGTIGVPIKTDVMVDERDGKRVVTYFLADKSYAMPQVIGKPAVQHDTRRLMSMLRDGTLELADPEHPLLYALQSLDNRERLLDFINKQEELILIRKPKSQRAAYVLSSATGHALDKVNEFFNRS